MAYREPSKENQNRNESGIALFMVLSSLSILALLVTELTWVTSVNRRMSHEALDQIKAHYLAKSGYKLSLLRLKAYSKLKETLSGDKNAAAVVPKGLIEKVWNFPFMYPIPTEVPGMSLFQKDMIEKFQKESALTGSYTSLIESESSKFNLNLILAPFVPKEEPKKDDKNKTNSSSSTSTSSTGTSSQNQNSQNSQNQSAKFDPEAARKSLYDYLRTILDDKFEKDEDFAAQYRDFFFDDFMTNLYAWADIGFQAPPTPNSIPPKRAPFYTLSELHMIKPLDDELYNLFAPALTTNTTPGINVNEMQEPVLRALVPEITDEEVTEFFKFRDSKEADNKFKKADDFFAYLLRGVGSFGNDQNAIDQFKSDLSKRNIRIVTDESEFLITIRAQVNQATRVLKAWVTLETPKATQSNTTPGAANSSTQGSAPPSSATVGANPNQTANTGLQIRYMRIQ